DGRYVAFLSIADDLVPIPRGSVDGCVSLFGTLCRDIFVRDLVAQTTTLVTINSAGTASGIGDASALAITPDGRRVAFASTANDLVAGTGSMLERNVFVRDVVAAATTLVSINRTGTAAGNNFSNFSAITPDGRYVAFSSGASDLVATAKGNASAC